MLSSVCWRFVFTRSEVGGPIWRKLVLRPRERLSVVHGFDVRDFHGQEPSVHRDGELVVEADLPEDEVELGVPWLEEPDIGAPRDVLIAPVVTVDEKVHLYECRFD